MYLVRILCAQVITQDGKQIPHRPLGVVALVRSVVVFSSSVVSHKPIFHKAAVYSNNKILTNLFCVCFILSKGLKQCIITHWPFNFLSVLCHFHSIPSCSSFSWPPLSPAESPLLGSTVLIGPLLYYPWASPLLILHISLSSFCQREMTLLSKTSPDRVIAQHITDYSMCFFFFLIPFPCNI